jgi:NAD(P)-dependent dehydrogenase (short-subunit alcohol dehydrogenase family)
VRKALIGKTALVTGGGSGLGREIALAYAEAGANVVVASTVEAQNDSVAEACRSFGVRSIAKRVDVRSEHDVRELFAHSVAEFGALDVLVAAAGLDVRRSKRREERHLHKAALDDWNTVIAVNLTGTFLCAREAVRQMLPRGSGSIVTFTSGTVHQPLPGISAYVASKAGVEALTRVLALELSGSGVRANALQPGGMTDTAFFPPWTPGTARAAMHRPAIVRGCAVYLASDESADISGASLIASEWNRERGLALCDCHACLRP